MYIYVEISDGNKQQMYKYVSTEAFQTFTKASVLIYLYIFYSHLKFFRRYSYCL